jgi:hypothetical protein
VLQHLRQRVERRQPLNTQPMRHRRLAAVRPRPRQRHLTAETTRADEHHRIATPLDEQDLKPPPIQRMERMSNDNKTRRIIGRRGSMPRPSAPPKFWCPRHAV